MERVGKGGETQCSPRSAMFILAWSPLGTEMGETG